MSEKMREEFKTWRDETYGENWQSLISEEENVFLWIGWKASRESLEVDLPGRNPEYIGDRDHQQWACGCNYGIENCRKAIQAAGVRTK